MLIHYLPAKNDYFYNLKYFSALNNRQSVDVPQEKKLQITTI